MREYLNKNFTLLRKNGRTAGIWAEYHENGELVNRKYQIPEEEVTQNQREKYYKMTKGDTETCECSDPFPNSFSYSC